MSLEDYKGGIHALLRRADLKQGTRQDLEQVQILLERAALNDPKAVQIKVRGRLRLLVNNLIIGRQFAEPPLPELQRELGLPSSPSPRPKHKPR